MDAPVWMDTYYKTQQGSISLRHAFNALVYDK